MQRLDHSMIYLLIAGTYVPLCLVALPPSWGIPMLAVVGTMAAVGMVLKLGVLRQGAWYCRTRCTRHGVGVVVAAPALIDSLTDGQFGLIVAGGVAYTVGLSRAAHASAPEPVADHVRLPRGVARVHRARGRSALRRRSSMFA